MVFISCQSRPLIGGAFFQNSLIDIIGDLPRLASARPLDGFFVDNQGNLSRSSKRDDRCLHRRQLNESQRAMMAAKWAKLKHGGSGANQHKRAESPIGDSAQSETKTRADASEMLKVGTSSIDRAKKILRLGSPELKQAVEAGVVSVNAAVKLAELPHTEQVDVLEQGQDAMKQKVKQLRNEKPAVAPADEEPEPVVVNGLGAVKRQTSCRWLT